MEAETKPDPQFSLDEESTPANFNFPKWLQFMLETNSKQNADTLAILGELMETRDAELQSSNTTLEQQMLSNTTGVVEFRLDVADTECILLPSIRIAADVQATCKDYVTGQVIDPWQLVADPTCDTAGDVYIMEPSAAQIKTGKYLRGYQLADPRGNDLNKGITVPLHYLNGFFDKLATVNLESSAGDDLLASFEFFRRSSEHMGLFSMLSSVFREPSDTGRPFRFMNDNQGPVRGDFADRRKLWKSDQVVSIQERVALPINMVDSHLRDNNGNFFDMSICLPPGCSIRLKLPVRSGLSDKATIFEGAAKTYEPPPPPPPAADATTEGKKDGGSILLGEALAKTSASRRARVAAKDFTVSFLGKLTNCKIRYSVLRIGSSDSVAAGHLDAWMKMSPKTYPKNSSNATGGPLDYQMPIARYTFPDMAINSEPCGTRLQMNIDVNRGALDWMPNSVLIFHANSKIMARSCYTGAVSCALFTEDPPYNFNNPDQADLVKTIGFNIEGSVNPDCMRPYDVSTYQADLLDHRIINAMNWLGRAGITSYPFIYQSTYDSYLMSGSKGVHYQDLVTAYPNDIEYAGLETSHGFRLETSRMMNRNAGEMRRQGTLVASLTYKQQWPANFNCYILQFGLSDLVIQTDTKGLGNYSVWKFGSKPSLTE